MTKSPALRTFWLNLYVPSFLLSVGQQGLLILLPLYLVKLNGNVAFAAAIVGLRGLGMMLFDIPAGMFVSRFGDKVAMLIALICTAAMSIAFILVETSWGLAIVTILYGMGNGAWLTARLSFITDSSDPTRRGRTIAVVAGIMRVGALLGPLLGGIVAEYIGFKIAFLGAGFLAVTAVLFIYLFAQNIKPDDSDGTTHLDRLVEVVDTNRYVFATGGMVALTLLLIRAARQILIPLYGARIGLDAAQIGLIYSLSSLVDFLMFYPAGYIMDKYGRKWTAGPCITLLSIALILLPSVSGFYGLLMVGLLSGFGNGWGTGVVMTLGSDLSPPGRRGEFLGVWRLISDLGLAGGPLLVSGLTKIGTLAIATYAVAGTGLLGLLILLGFVKETLDHKLRE